MYLESGPSNWCTCMAFTPNAMREWIFFSGIYTWVQNTSQKRRSCCFTLILPFYLNSPCVLLSVAGHNPYLVFRGSPLCIPCCKIRSLLLWSWLSQCKDVHWLPEAKSRPWQGKFVLAKAGWHGVFWDCSGRSFQWWGDGVLGRVNRAVDQSWEGHGTGCHSSGRILTPNPSQICLA